MGQFCLTISGKCDRIKMTTGGDKGMCKIVEEINEERIEIARRLIEMNALSAEQIAEASALSVDEVKKLMEKHSA